MTRKEQKEERRKSILLTALNLFVTKGYYDTKITDIAKASSMSTGLLFHYYESKEALLEALVSMGAEYSGKTDSIEAVSPDIYFEQLLNSLFEFAKTEPWSFQMFVLMGQARRCGMPENARKIAKSVNQIENSAKLIKKGQDMGIFREGDPIALSTCFWTSVQGIMEEIAYDDNVRIPDAKWILAIIMK